MMYKSDTIAAIATAPGKGGVGIVRLSGPEVKNIATVILDRLPSPRTAHFSVFKNTDNTVIDEGIALYFKAPHSFTGEDVLELQGHGGPVVLDFLLSTILSLGARLARPGEFSERAFLNNKIDLVQAEAIADLINANSVQAARGALRSLQGEFSKKIQSLVDQLIYLRTYIEAAIDFVDEEIDFIAEAKIAHQLEELLIDLEKIIHTANQGQLLQEGITIVIAGKPNAGKSSLLNLLSRKESAIVTEIPGTTRDILREYLQIDGLPIHLIDTAGLRDSEDPVEREGIRRAKKEIAQADLLLYLRDSSQMLDQDWKTLKAEIENCPPIVLINNKIDIKNTAPSIELGNPNEIFLSIKKEEGTHLLLEYIKKFAGFETQGEGTFTARRRHLDALQKTQIFLKNGLEQLRNHSLPELVAEDLRQAQQALNSITGEFTSDDLLGKIFGSFCIGK